MKNKNWFIPGIIAVFIAFGFLFIGFSSKETSIKDESVCCLKKINSCDGKSTKPDSGEMFMENLSRQFLSITLLAY